MNKSIFQMISDVVAGTDKKVGFDIQGRADGTIKVIITAKLGPVPVNASKEVKQLHAAISAPLVVVGTPGEVEEALAQRIDSYTETRNAGTDALEDIRVIIESAVAGAKATAGKAPIKPSAEANKIDSEEEEGEELDHSSDDAQGTADPVLPAAVVQPTSIQQF